MRPGPEQLKEWIERRQLTQRQAAEELEFGPTGEVALSYYLSGKRLPGRDRALSIQRIAGIPAESWTLSRISKTEKRVVSIRAKSKV